LLLISTMLNESGESIHVLFLVLEERFSVFHHWECCSLWIFIYCFNTLIDWVLNHPCIIGINPNCSLCAVIFMYLCLYLYIFYLYLVDFGEAYHVFCFLFSYQNNSTEILTFVPIPQRISMLLPLSHITAVTSCSTLTSLVVEDSGVLCCSSST
jgi:hypothetical protein